MEKGPIITAIDVAGRLLIPTISAAIVTGLAFHFETRRKILDRDCYTCQNPDCIGILDTGLPRSWKDGYFMQAAHYPDYHNGHIDTDLNNGRCLCTHCHVIEEILRGNYHGAQQLFKTATFLHHEAIAQNRGHDIKPTKFEDMVNWAVYYYPEYFEN